MTKSKEPVRVLVKILISKVPTAFGCECICEKSLIWFADDNIKLECFDCGRMWKLEIKAEAVEVKNA